LQEKPDSNKSRPVRYLGGIVERKTSTYLGATVERGGPAQARVYVFLDRRRGAAPAIALSCVVAAAVVVGRGSQCGEVAVVGGKLGEPDAVGGGSAAERTVEACDVADLRRVEVEQHRRHTALRHVAQRRLRPSPAAPLRGHHARRPRPHPSSDLECFSVLACNASPNHLTCTEEAFDQYGWNREACRELVPGAGGPGGPIKSNSLFRLSSIVVVQENRSGYLYTVKCLMTRMIRMDYDCTWSDSFRPHPIW
jgi:hypothetical protein